MIFTFAPKNADGTPATVTVIGSPVLADGITPSSAKLSSPSYASADSTVFTVAPDPATPNGAILTAVGNPAPGTSISALLTETATATEPDGKTTEVITGTATVVLSTPAAPPAAAAALVFTFGTPSSGAPGTPVPPPLPPAPVAAVSVKKA